MVDNKAIDETKEKVWSEYEKPAYSEDYMWDFKNRFNSLSEYLESIDKEKEMDADDEACLEYFEYHYLLGEQQ